MAAVISAFVAVVGLVITKEHKISEFRQQWIDSLRVDVSSLIGAINANQIEHEERATYRSIQLKLTELRYRIELRFKPGDETAVPLLLAISELVGYGGTLNNPTTANHLYMLTSEVKEQTQEILKHEWERVKAGEESYRRTLHISKIAAISTTSILFCYLIVRIFLAVFVPLVGWMISQFKG